MVFSTLSQSFSFHASPESFISARIRDLALSDPDLLTPAATKKKVVVASILNRDVHIVSSYQLCRDILEASSSPSPTTLTPSTISLASAGLSLPYAGASQSSLGIDTLMAGPAYHQFMSDFFPPPNLLLEDGPTHATHKQAWENQLSYLKFDLTPRVRQIAEKHISSLSHPAAGGADGRIDLYEKLRCLAWELLLSVFLDLSPSSSPEQFAQIESLQETLLRGQFSLFPVSINARLWQSSRSKGLEARRELQRRLGELVDNQDAGCPFLKQAKVSNADAASHALLFTSSIAVKALSSLLTAFVLNLLLWRDPRQDLSPRTPDGKSTERASTSLAELVRSQGDTDDRARLLRSIMLETERLSPPVVGVMRRVQRDVILRPEAQLRTQHQPQHEAAISTDPTSGPSKGSDGAPPHPPAHPVPAGHDIWLYLSGGARDRSVFGDDADVFRFDRYLPSSARSTALHSLQEMDDPPSGLAFGAGPKTCLGIDLVRQIILTVGEVLVVSGIEMKGRVEDKGVRGWLGWESGVPAEMVAKGMKQLPVQRPRVGVRVEVSRKGSMGTRDVGDG